MPGIQTKQFGLTNRRPAGFTLVELLVAMALIIFMLSIMSQAFVIATTCVQGMKGVGEILDRARPVLNTLQRDLGAYHFDGNRRLSEPDFWIEGPPKAGYFMIWQDAPFTKKENLVPLDGVTFNRSNLGENSIPPLPSANHMLAFTVRLDGRNPEDFFTAKFPVIAPLGHIFCNTTGTPATPAMMTALNPKRFDFISGTVHSQWAEVAYFLRSNPNTANGTPLCDLYRQVKLVLPSVTDANNLNLADTPKNKADLYEFSVRSENPNIKFNTPMDLTVPWKRQGDRVTSLLAPPITAPYLFTPFENSTVYPNGTHPGSYNDLLIPDVISFDVRLLTDDKLNFETLETILTKYPYNDSPNPGYQKNGRYVFDTWTTESLGGAFSFDLGDDSSGKWQPDPNATNNNRVPAWGWFKDGMGKKTTAVGLRINAIQISLRIWDAKTSKAREFKVIQRL